MRAVISDGREPPQFMVDCSEPGDEEGLAPVVVRAAALTNLDVLVARGQHYLSSRDKTAIVGREAVATDASGRRLFLNALSIPVPHGSMAERSFARLDHAWPVPDGVPDALAAAIGNAGLAGWLPLSWRARLAPGETVLVLGATGVTGGVAVAAARLLGAGRIVAVGRNRQALERLLGNGADAVVRLGDEEEPLPEAFRREAGGAVDVVIDYLNGPPAEAALSVMANGGRMVQVGSPLGPGMTLHAQTARRGCLDVLGFAYYHAPVELQSEAYRELCAAALAGAVCLPIRTLPMSRFSEAWDAQCAGSPVRYVIFPSDSVPTER